MINNTFLKIWFIISIFLFFFFLSLANAHRSGCHRWHSCPSDRGTYICGDLGYCIQCPDNQFCRDGKPIVQETPNTDIPKNKFDEEGVPPINKLSCPNDYPIKGNLTTKTGECIYHVLGGAFYEKTDPERCFVNETEALDAGCRKSKR